jgi:hypothetical protein
VPSFLNQRYLKLPVWVWILVVGAGLGVVLRMRHNANAAADGTDPNADPNATDAVPGDVTGGGGAYDPSGFMGFPAYTQPIGQNNDGIAATDPLQNINPDLAIILSGQQDLIATLATGGTQAGAQCGPGTHWDENSQRCVPNAVSAPPKTTTTTAPPKPPAKPPALKVLHPTAGHCAAGLRWDYYRGICTKCGPGTTYKATTKHCGPCPAGYRC